MDEARIRGTKCFEIDAAPTKRSLCTGCAGLKYKICTRHEPHQHVTIFAEVEIEGDGSFISVERGKLQALANVTGTRFGKGPLVPRGGTADRFNLYDISTEIRKDHGTNLTPVICQIENAIWT